MNFNFKSIPFFLAIGTMVAFSSCKDDDPEVEPAKAKPVISNIEIGDNNSKEAEVGGDLHLDVEVVAEGKIDKIKVDLHLEEGSGEEIEAEYTEYAGLLNVDFHKDLEIPATATPGEYHFHLMVIDQEGQTSSVEADVMIK